MSKDLERLTNIFIKKYKKLGLKVSKEDCAKEAADLITYWNRIFPK